MAGARAFAKPCCVSPARNSCATCRLNSMLWERCLAMGFILRKSGQPGQILNLDLSTPRGAPQIGGQLSTPIDRLTGFVAGTERERSEAPQSELPSIMLIS